MVAVPVLSAAIVLQYASLTFVIEYVVVLLGLTVIV